MKNIIYSIFALLILHIGFAQEDTDTFIMFDEKMSVLELDNEIKVSFGLQASDNRDCIYNFKIFNVEPSDNGWTYLKFDEIKNELIDFDPQDHTIHTLEALANLDYCTQNLLFADTKKLYLLRKIKGKYYKYRFQFISAQRGWSSVITH